MRIEFLSLLGGFGLMVLLGVMALVVQTSDNETSIFFYVIAAVLLFTAVALLLKAGIQ